MTRQEPDSLPLGVSDDGAIVLCRDWMLHLGAADTTIATGQVREICDLFSSHYLAWVDNERGNLETYAVERAASMALRDGRRPLIFKRGGIRLDAQRQADRQGVALFYYVPADGVLEGANTLGKQLRAIGLSA